jgi:hypothetical protein
MNKYKIRELIHKRPEEILERFDKKFEIEFDDGEVIEVTRKRTFASSFYWRIFLDFPEVKITKGCHFTHVLGSKMLQASSHAKLASNIFKMIAEHYEFVTPEQRERIQLVIQEATNELYVALRKHSGQHLQTIHLMDCIDLMYHPKIWEASMTSPASPKGVEHVYKVIGDVINNDKAYANNGMVKAVRSGAVKLNQVCQSIGVRGFPKEVNGRIFRHLARSNYLFGMNNLYEFAGDSRGSAEHLSATESPLQDSEYFSRRLQLQTCVLERIHYEDCGTHKTIPFFVRPAGIIESTGEWRNSDLKYLVGKYYVEAGTGKLKYVKESDKHLEGTTIQMRSVLTCEHPDAHGVCQVCFGQLSNNHSRWANLGVVSATTVVSKISQKTLSTKHHISSGQGSGIVFTDDLRLYFRRGVKNTDYVLQPDVLKWSPRLIVARDDALGLVDVVNSDDITMFNPERITSFEKIRIVYNSPRDGSQGSDTLKLEQGKRQASMSYQLLKYIHEHGYKTDERNNFVIHLDKWNPDDVIFTLPDIQVSFSAHGNAIAELIESKFENLAERSTEDAPIRVLGQVYDLVTPKLDVNIAPMEAIMYALLQAGVNNYAMGRGSETACLGIGKALIWNRSMGTAVSFQEWAPLLINPDSYRRKGVDTMMDVFIRPKEYLTYNSRTYVNSNYQRRLRGEPEIVY